MCGQENYTGTSSCGELVLKAVMDELCGPFVEGIRIKTRFHGRTYQILLVSCQILVWISAYMPVQKVLVHIWQNPGVEFSICVVVGYSQCG